MSSNKKCPRIGGCLHDINPNNHCCCDDGTCDYQPISYPALENTKIEKAITEIKDAIDHDEYSYPIGTDTLDICLTALKALKK